MCSQSDPFGQRGSRRDYAANVCSSPNRISITWKRSAARTREGGNAPTKRRGRSGKGERKTNSNDKLISSSANLIVSTSDTDNCGELFRIHYYLSHFFLLFFCCRSAEPAINFTFYSFRITRSLRSHRLSSSARHLHDQTMR